ncbi:MAG: hypothetical protein K2N95_00695 [Lachnospiraceae bacterium]|nr:hypothetical protein [Lachnospiraceae bacterium]
MNDWEEILPSEEEKNRAVMRIIDTAMPRKNSIWRELYQTANAVGLRTLFCGVGDCFFLAVLVLCVCLFPAALMVRTMHLTSWLFLVSPAFYALAHFLTTWKEYQSRTLEWKQTWRISFQTIMALRMLVLGAVSVVGSILICAVLWSLSRQAVSFVWMLSVAFSALFLYGGSSLLCQRLWGMRAVMPVPFVWIVLSLVPVVWEPASVWLMQIPVCVFLVIAAAGGGFYLAQMYYFVSGKSRIPAL